MRQFTSSKSVLDAITKLMNPDNHKFRFWSRHALFVSSFFPSEGNYIRLEADRIHSSVKISAPNGIASIATILLNYDGATKKKQIKNIFSIVKNKLEPEDESGFNVSETTNKPINRTELTHDTYVKIYNIIDRYYDKTQFFYDSKHHDLNRLYKKIKSNTDWDVKGFRALPTHIDKIKTVIEQYYDNALTVNQAYKKVLKIGANAASAKFSFFRSDRTQGLYNSIQNGYLIESREYQRRQQSSCVL